MEILVEIEDIFKYLIFVRERLSTSPQLVLHIMHFLVKECNAEIFTFKEESMNIKVGEVSTVSMPISYIIFTTTSQRFIHLTLRLIFA